MIKPMCADMHYFIALIIETIGFTKIESYFHWKAEIICILMFAQISLEGHRDPMHWVL